MLIEKSPTPCTKCGKKDVVLSTEDTGNIKSLCLNCGDVNFREDYYEKLN